MAHSEQTHYSRKKAGKRKRSSSAGLEAPTTPSRRLADLPENTINPFSHPPEKLAQFSLAGLSAADADPSATVKDFPHRGLGHGKAAASSVAIESDFDTDWETEASETDVDGNNTDTERQGDAAKKARRPLDPQRRQLDVLVRSMEQFLAQGNVDKAAKAFGLALQLRPRHLTADVRRDNLWAIGAEIIMREGEESEQHRRQGANEGELSTGQTSAAASNSNLYGTKEFQIPRRWGAAANMNKLRAYFETLIRQHPYDWRYPKYVSALDFNIALYSCEIYNVYSEHAAALAKFDAGMDDEDGGDDLEEQDDIMPADLDALAEDEEMAAFQPRSQLKAPLDGKERIRKQALAALTSVAERVDGLMREMPYAKNNQFLRLRAAASLYLADLMLPTNGVAEQHEERDAGMRSEAERHKAIRALQTVLQNGGALDKSSLSLLGSEGELQESLATHLYSTLPIREG
ncbi:hypothetical protein K4F52_001360 [Lecanicillium sp. MT-2017a]|nr:hypothetical protein K4F52_001360 [Lecanicillium sp. MT-2017a]